MFSLETALLGVALAIDAAVASFAIGLLHVEKPKHYKLTRGASVAGVFGVFQFFMLWFGSMGGYALSFSNYGYLFQLVVASVFVFIGMKVLKESFDMEDKTIEWGAWPLMMMAVLTSIDALAAGISLGAFPQAYMSALEVGIITFLLCGLSYSFSSFLKSFPAHWLLRLAAGIFFFLGGQIIVGYFSNYF